MTQTTKTRGQISAVIGPVVDVIFDEAATPSIYEALEMNNPSTSSGQAGARLVLEVAQQFGGGTVRTVALGATDGIRRGQEVTATGSPVQVPAGRETLGRIFNVLGDAIDGGKNLPDSQKRLPIHREPPAFTHQSTEIEILETGIKVIDLIAPIIKGGKVGLFGGAGVGKTVIIQELINNI